MPDSITKKIIAKNNKNSLKFDEIADAFFSYKLEKEPDNAVNIKEQRRDYEIYHKDKLGGLATTQITPETISEHHKDISQIISPKTKRKLSQSRINAIMGIVRTIFNHAIKNDLIDHISPYKIELKKTKQQARKVFGAYRDRTFTQRSSGQERLRPRAVC